MVYGFFLPMVVVDRGCCRFVRLVFGCGCLSELVEDIIFLMHLVFNNNFSALGKNRLKVSHILADDSELHPFLS